MDTVVVPFKANYLRMTKEEAKQLIRDVTIRLERAEANEAGLNPPHVSDGLMNRDDFHEFFAQIYPQHTVARSRAGHLFSGIIKSVQQGGIAFKIVCLSCEQKIEGATPGRFAPHWRHKLAVDVTSLKKHADDFVKSGLHLATSKMVEDFQTLCDHLDQV